jgi:hypothetical protein
MMIFLLESGLGMAGTLIASTSRWAILLEGSGVVLARRKTATKA